MTNEVWKPVPGWPYSASSLGRVMRSAQATTNTRVGRLLKPILQSNGYQHIQLCRNGQKKQHRLHVLIATVFFGPANGRQVNHKDTDKTNNRIENLEYVSQAEHDEHTTRLGLKPRGPRNYNTRMTEQVVREIRKSPATTTARMWSCELARRGIHVGVGGIRKARSGTNWAYVKEKNDVMETLAK